MRAATLIIALLDAVVWAMVVGSVGFSTPEPATRGLDQAALYLISVLFVLTGAPALFLAVRRRAVRTAFALSLAFPGLFAVLFVAAALMLP